MTLRIINIISVIVLTASAVIGLLFDFRDETGIITEWGIIVLSITILSGISAIITEILEYREKRKDDLISETKEANRNETLQRIESGIISSNSPLVPFRALITIKSEEKNLDKINEVSSHSKVESSIIKTDYLQLVGAVRMGENPYNMESENPKKWKLTIRDRTYLNELLSNRTLTIWPVIEVTIKPQFNESDNLIKFKYPVDPFNIVSNTSRELRIYDNHIYQDCLADRWTIKGLENKLFGVQDLLHSKIIVRAFYSKGEMSNPDFTPEFTNIIFYFGSSPNYLLSFTSDQLKEHQIVTNESEEDSFFKLENDLAKEMFQRRIQTFEIEITDEIFNNQLKIHV